ncbi:MAG: aspartate-semialdehyde dehydrogenase [Eggerthellaceae bacterium]|nr:aspartate-semialdehyde dehydrogenase [Eggerthellaceae bacterium]
MAYSKEIPANPVVAIAGATGAVGREFLKVLHDLDFPAKEVRALASARSAGKKIHFEGCGSVPAGDLVVEEMTDKSFEGVDIALFSCGASVSRQFREAVLASGAVMIDNSSAFRMETDVPLIVPEVNPQDIEWHSGIIANPNCSTIQMVVALKPLNDIAHIKRVVVSTYQAASGAGAKGMNELYDQTREFLDGTPQEELTINAFKHQIAFNCIPHIDVFMDDASTKEEWKMVVETKKIMGDPSIMVAATCVRVPVLRCHSEAVFVEFDEPISAEEAREALSAAPGIVVVDDPFEAQYPMPAMMAGSDATYVGRIRRDSSVENGIAMWVVADQVRKGAALNAVQIAQLLLP